MALAFKSAKTSRIPALCLNQATLRYPTQTLLSELKLWICSVTITSQAQAQTRKGARHKDVWTSHSDSRIVGGAAHRPAFMVDAIYSPSGCRGCLFETASGGGGCSGLQLASVPSGPRHAHNGKKKYDSRQHTKIRQEMMSAQTLHGVIALLEEHSDLNAMNSVVALQCVARTFSRETKDASITGKDIKAAAAKAADRLMDRLLSGNDFAMLEPRQVASMLQSHVQLGQSPQKRLLEALIAFMVCRISSFSSHDLVNTLSCLASLGIHPGKVVMEKIKMHALVRIQDFTTLGIARAMQALSKLGEKIPPSLLQGFRDEVCRAQSLDTHEVSNLLVAFAKLKVHPGDPVLVVLRAAVLANAKEFNSQHIANVLWSFATLGAHPGDAVMRCLTNHMTAKMREFSAQNLSNTLWSFATLGHDPGTDLLVLMTNQALSVIHTYTSQGIANTMWAHATLRVTPSPALTRALGQHCVSVIHTFSEQNVSNMLWAYAVLAQTPEVNMLRALEHRAFCRIHIFTTQALANTLWSFATLGVLPQAELLEGISARMASIKGMLKPQEASNMLWSCAIFSEVGPSRERDALRHIQQLLVAALCDMHVPDFCPEEIGMIAWSCAVLDLTTHPAIMRFVANALAVHAVNMSDSSLCQVHQLFLSFSLSIQSHGGVPLHKSNLPLEKLESSIGTKCREVFEARAGAAKPSSTQRRVAQCVRDVAARDMALAAVLEEAVDAKSGYSIDIVILVRDGPSRGSNIAIEVDGPRHYLLAEEGGERLVMGGTAMKRRHLQALGYRTLTFAYWEFDACETKEAQEAYVSTRLSTVRELMAERQEIPLIQGKKG